MNVLIGCEESGIVCEAFRKRGHNAWSCDILPSRKSVPHLQGDLLNFLYLGWDLAIFFPPCDYLCSSGLFWNHKIPGRADQTERALRFVSVLLNAPIPRIAVENPKGCIGTRIKPASQRIQPWQFGHREAKETFLWLKNLAPLQPTKIIPKPACGYWDNQTPSEQNKLGPSADRKRLRSQTYQGIADAMAEQWG